MILKFTPLFTGSLGFSAEEVASAVSNGASASPSSTSNSPVTTESSSNGTPTTTPSVETATPTVTVPSASSEKDKEASASLDDTASSIGKHHMFILKAAFTLSKSTRLPNSQRVGGGQNRH